MDDRTSILNALADFIAKRPGLDPANYDRAGYRADYNKILQAKHDAERLLAEVRATPAIDAEALRYALDGNFMGRLQWNGSRLDYTTGQYWPTEYRAAVCSVLAGALWNYWREQTVRVYCGKVVEERKATANDIRGMARRKFGPGIARRWFN